METSVIWTVGHSNRLMAEMLPWRCHRRHILGARSVRPHRLTEIARVVQGQVTYPGQTNE